MINKISPYSQVGVHKALYHLIIEEWSGLSNVKSSDNENFSDLLDDIIHIATIHSDLFFDPALITYIDRHKSERMAIKNEFSTKSFETKELEILNKTLKTLLIENKKFDFIDFNRIVCDYIENKYIGIESLSPKKINSLSDENIEEYLLNIKDTKKERLQSFKGLSFKRKESFHFVDAITAPIVYYNKTNNIRPIETMITGISSYVLKLTEVKNTKLIIKKLEEIAENNLKIDDEKFNFGQFSKIKKKQIKQDKVMLKDVDRILKRKVD